MSRLTSFRHQIIALNNTRLTSSIYQHHILQLHAGLFHIKETEFVHQPGETIVSLMAEASTLGRRYKRVTVLPESKRFRSSFTVEKSYDF